MARYDTAGIFCVEGDGSEGVEAGSIAGVFTSTRSIRGGKKSAATNRPIEKPTNAETAIGAYLDLRTRVKRLIVTGGDKLSPRSGWR